MMSRFAQWFMMNGYALYVWSAYGLVLLTLIGSVVHVRSLSIRTRRLLRQWWDRA